MKKILFLFALIGALFASCSENEINDPNVIANDDGAITFRTLRDKTVTRNANDNADNYFVYAILEGGENWYFDTSVNVGTGETEYYWPQKTLDFYAFCPSPTSNMTVTATPSETAANRKIDIAYTVPTTVDQDFTIATPVLNAVKPTDNDGKQALAFSHMLSKITVQVQLANDLTSKYTLTSGWSAVLNVLYTSGTIDAVTAKAATDPTTWVLPNAPTSTTPYTVASTSTTPTSSFIIMPQETVNTTTPLSLQITNVTINTANGDEYFKNNLAPIKFTSDLTNFPTAFEVGYQYNFVITITENSEGGEGTDPTTPIFNGTITFTSSIADWSGPTSVTVDNP